MYIQGTPRPSSEQADCLSASREHWVLAGTGWLRLIQTDWAPTTEKGARAQARLRTESRDNPLCESLGHEAQKSEERGAIVLSFGAIRSSAPQAVPPAGKGELPVWVGQ